MERAPVLASKVPITVQVLTEDWNWSGRASPGQVLKGNAAGLPGSRGETEASTNVSQVLTQKEAEDRKAASLNTSFTASGTPGREGSSSRVSPVKTANASAHQSPKPRLRPPADRPLDPVQLALKSLILSAKGFLSTIQPVFRSVKEGAIRLKFNKLTSAIDFSTQILEAAEYSSDTFSQSLYSDLEQERRRSEILLQSLQTAQTRLQQNNHRDKQLLTAIVATTSVQLEARLSEVTYKLQHITNRCQTVAKTVERLMTKLTTWKGIEIRVKTLSKEVARMKTFEMLYYKTQKTLLNLQKEAFVARQKSNLQQEVQKLKSETSSLGDILDSRQERYSEALNMRLSDFEGHFQRSNFCSESQKQANFPTFYTQNERLSMLNEDLRSALHRSDQIREELQIQVGDLLAENSVLGSENSFLNKEYEEMKADSPFLDFASEGTAREMKAVVMDLQREIQAAVSREEALRATIATERGEREQYWERLQMALEDENRTVERVGTILQQREMLGNAPLLGKEIAEKEANLEQYQCRLLMAQEDELRAAQRGEMVKNLRRRLEKHYDLMRENEHLKSRVTQQQYVHEHLHKRLQAYSSPLPLSTPVLPSESPAKASFSDFDLKMQFETMVKYQEMLCLGYFQVAAKVTQVQSAFGDLRKSGKLLAMLEIEKNREDGLMLGAVENGLEDIRGLWVELREKYEAAGGVLSANSLKKEAKVSTEEASFQELLRNSDLQDSASSPTGRQACAPELSKRLQLLRDIELLFSPYTSELDHLFPLLKSLLPKLHSDSEDNPNAQPLSTCAASLPRTGDQVSQHCCYLDPAPSFNIRSLCEHLASAKAAQDFSGKPQVLKGLKEAVLMLTKTTAPHSNRTEQLASALQSYFEDLS